MIPADAAPEDQPMTDTLTARAEQLQKQVEMVIKAAYTGSAEHGSFFRGGSGEMSPNAFIVLEELQSLITEQAQQIATLRQALTETQKALAITKLAVPLEDELSDRIDEVCKQLAMEDGFTLAGIARLLTDCQRRMAADWDVIGSERRERQAAETRVRALEAANDTLNSLYEQTEAKRLEALAALADLRAKVRVLVGLWRITEPAMGKHVGAIVKCCADELAALIPPETP